MALKSIIFKAALQVNDLDRHYYQSHALTIARHPSETDERMMMRLLAFGLHADQGLAFGKGLSTNDEPDLWQKDLTGAITLWIEVGLPDAKWLRRAAGRARQVIVYAYGRGVDSWWNDVRNALERTDSLRVLRINAAPPEGLAQLVDRSMNLHCTIQDPDITLSGERSQVSVQLDVLKEFRTAMRG